MAEVFLRAEVIGVRFGCDVCNGEMLPDPSLPARLTHPPYYAHRCNGECGGIQYLARIYPTYNVVVGSIEEIGERKDG
jgi:hypothetical protein